MEKSKLDEYEQDILDNFEVHIALETEEKNKMTTELVEAAQSYNDDATKISLLVPNRDLSKLKNKASKLGISYRTYILKIFQEAS